METHSHENQLTETLVNAKKLFSFYSSHEDDPELRAIIKEEIDRLLSDALDQSRSFPSEVRDGLNVERCEEGRLGSEFMREVVQVKEFMTEFRSKKRKRREAFFLAEEDGWLSFSSQDESHKGGVRSEVKERLRPTKVKKLNPSAS